MPNYHRKSVVFVLNYHRKSVILHWECPRRHVKNHLESGIYEKKDISATAELEIKHEQKTFDVARSKTSGKDLDHAALRRKGVRKSGLRQL